VQFDGQRAASVRAAPLLGEQSSEIRDAVTATRQWPAVQARAASRVVNQ
jgi:hypothetical protein